jgi:hypothetical protein
MHDPLTGVFEIRRPWPSRDDWKTELAERIGERWSIGGAFWVVAGRGLYWPTMITIWHRDPSGYDDATCRHRRWRAHLHHWRIQIHPLQQIRRRLFTRCSWCGGRDRKGDPVNISHSWDREPGRWWRVDRGAFHRDCSSIERAHVACVCEHPVLANANHGRCARCLHYRVVDVTSEQLERMRELARIPHGERGSG